MSDSTKMGSLGEQMAIEIEDHAIKTAIAWKARTGRKIVGIIGTDVPFEIIEAAGCYPMRIDHGRMIKPDHAGAYSEIGDSEIIASLAEPLLSGRYNFLDHLVIGNTPIFNAVLFQFLRESYRRDNSLLGFEISFHEMHHGGKESAKKVNRDSCIRLANRMAGLAREASPAALGQAISRWNNRRQKVERLRLARSSTSYVPTGLESLAFVMKLQTSPFETPKLPTIANSPQHRLMLTGSDVSHFAHYAAIEAHGAIIVADDHNWGDDAFCNKVSIHGDPIDAIADRYTDQSPRSVRWPSEQRIASVVRRARAANVTGALFWICEEDHPPSWDQPDLALALQQAGIATLNLGPQPAVDNCLELPVNRVAEWLSSLKIEHRPEMII